MIKTFVTVYPGHIDLPDMGQNATPANERRYPSASVSSSDQERPARRR